VSAPPAASLREAPAPAAAMTHPQILEALSGLLLGLFVAILSSTIVTNALPRILSDIGGGEAAYTWVVAAALLSVTATTPIWGKLSDLYSKKLLVQLAIGIYIAGSALAGLSTSAGMLIGCRVVQGIGAGGLTALTQVILATIVAPRERGRYSGYLGAVFAVATVSGPLVGGVVVDTSWLGWRWCFYIAIPFALAALVLLQRTLHVPTLRRAVRIDYAGGFLITAGVSTLLVWVSLAGQQFAWASAWSGLLVALGVALLGGAAAVESRAGEPVIPLRLFRQRTIALATLASVFIGVSLFASTVFLGQYFQLGRGASPTRAGMLTIPLVLSLAGASAVVGRRITSTGRWKRYLVGGTVLLLAGLVTLSTVRTPTPYLVVAAAMALTGAGIGMTQQNLVLAVQNSVPLADLGAGSALVSFARSLGGAIGVSALGALFASRVVSQSRPGLAGLGVATGGGGGIPDLAGLPAPVAHVLEHAYGVATGSVFLAGVPLVVLALVAVLAIREVPLRSSAADATSLPSQPDPGHGQSAPPGVERSTGPRCTTYHSERQLISEQTPKESTFPIGVR